MAGHVTISSPLPLKTHRVGQRCTLNLSRAQRSSRWCGVVDRRGVPGILAMCGPHNFDPQSIDDDDTLNWQPHFKFPYHAKGGPYTSTVLTDISPLHTTGFQWHQESNP
ncbi:hypothetical protein TNCV_1478001 [Trichonephila clavipes]|nr:hypothetical protein TNCV_1478001 [Trichonephila clavipes]